ncbi:MAG: hypothetical protein QM775_19510 [Pirellulales bacterium]
MRQLLNFVAVSAVAFGCLPSHFATAAESDAATSHEPEHATAAALANSPRPSWVDRAPMLNGGTYETKVLVGPEATRVLLDRATQDAVRAKILEYATSLAGPEVADAVLADEAKLRTKVVGQQWEEHVRTAAGDSIFLHTQLRFDAQLQTQWRATAQQSRSESRSYRFIAVFLKAMWVVLLVHLVLRLEARKPWLPWRIAAAATALVLAAWPIACDCLEETAVAMPTIAIPSGTSVEVH